MTASIWDAMGLTGKRALIVHHDDLGYTQAQNAAYWQLGFPTGAVMLPGAWAPELVQFRQKLPGADLGVHLTLTSEWEYPRIRPLTPGPSLRDPSGHYWSTLPEAWQHVDPDEAEAELRAQVEGALALGLDVTHVDTHMGTVLRPDIAQRYLQVALSYRLPAFWMDDISELMLPEGFREPLEALAASSPLPALRPVDTYPVPAAQKREWLLDTLPRLGPGVYHLIHHAAVPTPEGSVLPDWEKRRSDLEALSDSEVRRVIREFVPLTYREVRDAIRRYA